MNAATICRDPQEALSQTILEMAGPDAAFTAIRSRPWASATFVGRKFRMILRLNGHDGPGRSAVLARMLPRHDFAIPGQIVADLQVDEQESGTDEKGAPFASLTLTVLTVEDT